MHKKAGFPLFCVWRDFYIIKLEGVEGFFFSAGASGETFCFGLIINVSFLHLLFYTACLKER
jgi:hypothetical protein